MYDTFQFHASSKALADLVSVTMAKTRENPGQRCPIRWGTLVFAEDGFRCQWNQRRVVKTVYMFLKRLIGGLPGADVPGAWWVRGVADVPALAASGAAAPAAPPASSQGDQDRPGPFEVQAPPSVQITWPRFKARRLFDSACSGVGPGKSAYKLGEKLGQGTFGTVWASRLGGHDLAVKVFKEGCVDDALCEASLAERLEHPNVVRLLDCVTDGRKSLLIYERAHCSLSCWIRREFPMGRTIPATGFVAMVMRDISAGLVYLHSEGIWHGDLKPNNILVASCQGGGGRRFLIGDVGSSVEVGRVSEAMVSLGHTVTTLWYRPPEVAAGQGQASAGEWLRADVWALGIILHELLGFSFHQVPLGAQENQRLEKQLRVHLGVGLDSSAPVRRKVFSRANQDRIGWMGADFATRTTAWVAKSRPSAALCLGHPFLCAGRLQNVGDGRVMPGFRHDWRFLSGCMEPEILRWLRAEAEESLGAWKTNASTSTPLEGTGATKFVVSGRVSDQCYSKSLNGLDVSQSLPAPRLRAFVRAFVAVNHRLIVGLAGKIQSRLERLRAEGEDIGSNGRFVLEHSVFRWFLVAGEIHVIDRPCGIEEARHVDGAAGSLTMGITLFGCRHLRIWPRAEAEERKEGVKDDPTHVAALAPGSVYLGTLAGPEHQAAHALVQPPDSLQGGHSVTLIVRTSLFPYNQSRRMKAMANPAITFKAVVEEMVSAFEGAWRLPTMQECMGQS